MSSLPNLLLLYGSDDFLLTNQWTAACAPPRRCWITVLCTLIDGFKRMLWYCLKEMQFLVKEVGCWGHIMKQHKSSHIWSWNCTCVMFHIAGVVQPAPTQNLNYRQQQLWLVFAVYLVYLFSPVHFYLIPCCCESYWSKKSVNMCICMTFHQLHNSKCQHTLLWMLQGTRKCGQNAGRNVLIVV